MSIAIAEKRPQQSPGGCVGIFFHHLFSKNKLFSKKLLPPVKKVAALKFAGDDKVPMGKLLLIPDESQSGYLKPEPEPNSGSRMQAPGIVARLMGLELMPVVPHEKPRKVMDSELDNEGDFEHSRLDHGLCLDNAGYGKAESRPQKLQKTERFIEKGAGSEFHKGLITGSRNKQQVRLGSPSKSPRLLSGSNTARLVQVANRILEPGLHSRNRARPAILYRSKESFSDSLLRSCSSCGGLVTAKKTLISEFVRSDFNFGNATEERKELKSAIVTSWKPKNESPEDQTKLKSEEGNKSKSVGVVSGKVKNESLTVQAKVNVESRVRDSIERKQGLGTVEDQPKKSYVKKNSLRQNQLPLIRDAARGRKQAGRDLNESQNGGKDFLASNKNLDSRARSKSPTEVSSRRNVEPERNGWEKKMCRKKRPISSSRIGSVRAVSSTFGKEKNVRSDVNNKKETGLANSWSTARSCVLDGNGLSGSNDRGIVSFTFNSPMRHDSRSSTREGVVEKRRGQGACLRNKSISDENIGSSSSLKGMTSGLELSSLLEDKIRELSSLDSDELARGDDLPGRSTASILEELISALTMGTPESQNDGDSFSDVSIRTDINISHNQISNVDREFQEKPQHGIITAYLTSDGNQPSPVSILEASFSSDTYSLGSPNGSSGGKTQFGLPEICKKTLSLDLEADLVDTATSLHTSPPDDKKMHLSVNNSSGIYEVQVPKPESSEATDAELFFESISLSWSDGSVDSFLLDILDTITDAFILKFNAKEGNQLREFLYDCMMESLNLKFSPFCGSGFSAFVKLPLVLDREWLLQEVQAEISGWCDLAGKFMGDLVEKEMNMSNINWTEHNAETFDVVVEIQSDILQTLIDEMLIDHC